ncbi:MAG TPA: response regulator, partial [Polyangia bacterium]|nr:response regulator [Polyangia bacterium]
DDPLNLDALTRVLRASYDLVRAESTDQALRILSDEGKHIDLILADKSMPGRSGVELLEEAKRLSQAMRIVLTAYPDASDLMEAINRGEVYRYVTKPWSPEELKVVIAHALEHYQLGRDNAELIGELKRKNAELKAMATRVADAFLKRLDTNNPQAAGSAEGALALRDVLAAAAYPTVKTAAKAIVQALTRARERIREPGQGHEIDYFDVVARDCLAEARRILSVVDEVDELAQ